MAKYKIEVNRTNTTIAKGKLSFYIDDEFQFTTDCWENPNNLIKAKKYTKCSSTLMVEKGYKSVFLPDKQTGKKGIFIHQGSKPTDSDGCIVCAKDKVHEIYNQVPRDKQNIEIIVKDNSLKSLSFDKFGRPSKSVLLGYVNLDSDQTPVHNKEYNVVNASDSIVGEVPYPEESSIKKLDLTLLKFWNQNLKDILKKNEGLVQLSLNSILPQDGRIVDRAKPTKDVEYIQEFEVKDGYFAPTFLNKAVYRNLLFEEFVNFKIDLIELDDGAIEIFEKFSRVLAEVPELKNIDILKSQPYIGMAAKLAKGLVMNFSPKDPNDHFWGETPILELNPGPAGAFLRRGIYIILQEENQDDETMSFENLTYKNGVLSFNNNKNDNSIANYLIFSINIKASDYQVK